MIRCITIDDEPLALIQLTGYIEKVPFLKLVKACNSALEALDLLAKESVDLIFADINMPDLNGVDFVKSLVNKPIIIFTTAYTEYAIEGFRVNALDYLLKPFEEQELRDILARFVEQAEAGQRMSYPIGAPLHTGQTFIVFTPTNDMRALRPAEIGFFRYCSERKQWEVILNNQPPLVLRRGMTAEQITQYSSSFVQIHQSYIINIDYLMIIKDSKCMLYPPFDKVTELLVSRKYKKELQDRFCL